MARKISRKISKRKPSRKTSRKSSKKISRRKSRKQTGGVYKSRRPKTRGQAIIHSELRKAKRGESIRKSHRSNPRRKQKNPSMQRGFSPIQYEKLYKIHDDIDTINRDSKLLSKKVDFLESMNFEINPLYENKSWVAKVTDWDTITDIENYFKAKEVYQDRDKTLNKLNKELRINKAKKVKLEQSHKQQNAVAINKERQAVKKKRDGKPLTEEDEYFLKKAFQRYNKDDDEYNTRHGDVNEWLNDDYRNMDREYEEYLASDDSEYSPEEAPKKTHAPKWRRK